MNRAQHFVPQICLRPFHDPSLANEHVWVYKKGKSPRHAAVKKVAHQRDFYSFLHEGERNNLVDEYFQNLEGNRAGARLRQLAETGRLSQEDKEFLAKFIGVMSARVPVARILADDIAGEKLTEELSKYVNDPELFEQQFKAVRLDPPMKSETVRQMLLQGYRFQQADDFYNLQMMLDMAQLNYEGLLDMDWIVWCASGDLQFITSDNPVVSILPQGGGEARLGRSFSIPEIEIIFPLSPSACLFARRGVAAGLRAAPNMRVRQVNKVLMGMAHRWIFAAENSSKIARLFDRIGGTGGYGNDFYEYRPEIFQHKKSRREGEAQTSTALDET